ncbi:TPA: hypothetical protein ACGR6T_000824 [Klebsiella aerogenes]|nr:hypothetical protein [Klebsiella aerogenes]
MNEDYMMFGAGLTGEVRRYEAGLTEISSISKPEPHATASSILSNRSAITKFEVGRVSINGKIYNFCFVDERPSNEALNKAILKYNPRPVN